MTMQQKHEAFLALDMGAWYWQRPVCHMPAFCCQRGIVQSRIRASNTAGKHGPKGACPLLSGYWSQHPGHRRQGEQQEPGQQDRLVRLRGGGHLEALPVLLVQGVGGGLEDERLALQHVVLPHQDLHEGLAATEVQEGPPEQVHTHTHRCRAVQPYTVMQLHHT